MSIRLQIDGGSVVEIDDDTITLGTDPSCTVPLASREDLAPKHAVIRKVAGRWIVEVREAAFIQVGDEPPSRMHWLDRGDVIRLTETGPEITFEPGRASTHSASQTRQGTEAPGSGANRPVLRNTQRPPESLQLSRSRPVNVPPLQDAIELDELKTGPAKPSRPAPPKGPAPPTRSDEFASAPRPRPVPPAIKSTSWLETSPSTAAIARQNRARRGFWLQGAVVAVLAVVAIAVWKFGGGSNSTPQPASAPQNSPDVAHVPATEPPAPAAPPSGHSAMAAASTENRSRPVETPRTGETNTTRPATGTGNPGRSPSGSSQAHAPAAIKGSDNAAPSATLIGVRDGVFAVFARHPQQEHSYRLGTAWAVSGRELVTSGAVVMAAEELRREGLTILVLQPSRAKPIAVKEGKVHDAYRQAVERAAAAHEQIAAGGSDSTGSNNPEEGAVPPEEALNRALSTQARFDLGVLEVASGERLTSPLSMDAGDLPDVARAEYTMVGFPFHPDQYRAESASLAEQPQERRNPVGGAAKSDSTLTLTMGFSDDVADLNWSGSPVFDRNRRVIGVYSRPTKQTAKGASSPRHAVIWLGRLREFAPELE